MDKITFTFLLNIIPAGLLIWSDQMLTAVIILILAAIIDTLTGITKACYCGDFKTSIAWDKGLKKFIRLFIAICSSYILELIGNIGLPVYTFLMNSFIFLCCFWAILEILSIFENLDDMGLPVPTGFIKYIRRNIDKECNNKK